MLNEKSLGKRHFKGQAREYTARKMDLEASSDGGEAPMHFQTPRLSAISVHDRGRFVTGLSLSQSGVKVVPIQLEHFVFE